MRRRGDRQLSGPPPDGQSSGGGDLEARLQQDNFGEPDSERTAELELIDAALSGNIDAFADLFVRYRKDIYALCMKQLGDPSLAEDVVQEAFIKAFANLSKFDRSKSFWPWLSTMAFRMCIDLQRRRSFTHYSGEIGISVEEGAVSNGTSEKEGESALDAVIASEERAEVWESLGILPKRQRRVFLLYAVDGWSCSDIAAAEGISVGAVKLLLFRARRKMRAVRQSELPALVTFPMAWLRSRVQGTERTRILLGALGEKLSGAGTLAMSLGMFAMFAATVNHPAQPFEGNGAKLAEEAFVSSAQSQSLQTISPNPKVAPVSAPVHSRPEQSVTEAAGPLVDTVINPNENATPENAALTSIMASPDYEQDHTILALGGPSSVLFVSNDGGASWKPLPSRFLFPSTYMAVPSGYPQDRRIFVLGNEVGLQQSDDRGLLFRPVSPLLGWSLAISPSFGRGDSKLLVGGKSVFEYDAGLGLTQPSLPSLPLARGLYSSIVFSPSYPSDPTVFVSDSSNIHYRCVVSVCEVAQFPIPARKLLLSPRFTEDGLAYVLTANGLFVSNDWTRTFQEVPLPSPDRATIRGADILWNMPGAPAVFVSTLASTLTTSGGSWSYLHRSYLHRSFDGGSSWTSAPIDVSNLRYAHLDKLVVTPTGRLFVTGASGGIACSGDFGDSWAPRCTPEP